MLIWALPLAFRNKNDVLVARTDGSATATEVPGPLVEVVGVALWVQLPKSNAQLAMSNEQCLKEGRKDRSLVHFNPVMALAIAVER
jgi:hypothetical protein